MLAHLEIGNLEMVDSQPPGFKLFCWYKSKKMQQNATEGNDKGPTFLDFHLKSVEKWRRVSRGIILAHFGNQFG